MNDDAIEKAKKEVTAELEEILDRLPYLMSFIKSDVQTIAINEETNERMLITISKQMISKKTAIDISEKFDGSADGAVILKGEGFDEHLRS